MIKLKDPFVRGWNLYNEGRQVKFVDDALLPRIVSLTTQATGLKFLMLEANALTLTQNEKFRQMLDQPDKWMIRTLSIKCSVKTTLACLKKCDPMHLTGVEFKSNEPEVTDLASPFSILGDEGILTLEYNALKAFYKMRDDSRNQSPLLKRLRVRYHTHSESPATIGLVKETFDKVAFITKDFPNLEWLIIHEEKSIWPISGDTGNDLQAWVSAL